MNRKQSRAKRKEANRRQRVAKEIEKKKNAHLRQLAEEKDRIEQLSRTQARKEKREREAALQELRAL